MTAVTKLLGNDFEMRVGSMPGNPIPRAAWIRQSFAESAVPAAIDQMAVHDFGKFAVVSYARRDKAAKGNAIRDIFIVDIWSQGAGDWKLAIRYAAPAGREDYPIPGVPIAVPAFEKKE